jgi:hypothetical protein
MTERERRPNGQVGAADISTAIGTDPILNHRADHELRCAWLRAHADLLYEVDTGGLLSAQLRDFADLLEVVAREGWSA